MGARGGGCLAFRARIAHSGPANNVGFLTFELTLCVFVREAQTGRGEILLWGISRKPHTSISVCSVFFFSSPILRLSPSHLSPSSSSVLPLLPPSKLFIVLLSSTFPTSVFVYLMFLSPAACRQGRTLTRTLHVFHFHSVRVCVVSSFVCLPVLCACIYTALSRWWRGVRGFAPAPPSSAHWLSGPSEESDNTLMTGRHLPQQQQGEAIHQP